MKIDLTDSVIKKTPENKNDLVQCVYCTRFNKLQVCRYCAQEMEEIVANNSKGLTYSEDGAYWAVVKLPGGHEYYDGPHKSRSTAYRRSVFLHNKEKHAAKIGMIYNHRAK
jgi:hypothetical protein